MTTDLFEGREVITRECAYTETAFGKKLPKPSPVTGVNECLLSDGATVFECAEGDYVNADIQRVIRHRGKHTESARKYPADVVAKVMAYREQERAEGIRGSSERVATRLNKEKVKRPDGQKWLAHNVDSLARHHQGEQDQAVDALLNSAATAAVAVLVSNPNTPKIIEAVSNRARAITIATKLTQARALLDEVLQLEAVFSGCDHDDYDELKAKADMLDQMRSFMGEGK